MNNRHIILCSVHDIPHRLSDALTELSFGFRSGIWRADIEVVASDEIEFVSEYGANRALIKITYAAKHAAEPDASPHGVEPDTNTGAARAG